MVALQRAQKQQSPSLEKELSRSDPELVKLVMQMLELHTNQNYVKDKNHYIQDLIHTQEHNDLNNLDHSNVLSPYTSIHNHAMCAPQLHNLIR